MLDVFGLFKEVTLAVSAPHIAVVLDIGHLLELAVAGIAVECPLSHPVALIGVV